MWRLLTILSLAGQITHNANGQATGSGSSVPIDLSPILSRDHNNVGAVRAELLETNLIRSIATSLGIPADKIPHRVIQTGPIFEQVWVTAYDSNSLGQKLSERLFMYAQARRAGHTAACLWNAITNQSTISMADDPDKGMLVGRMPLLPSRQLVKISSGFISNVISGAIVNSKSGFVAKANQPAFTPIQEGPGHWCAFSLIDGEIGWIYTLRFGPEGELSRIDCLRVDAQELQPATAAIIREIDSALYAQAARDGVKGAGGPVHHFWASKKELLKRRAINWSSPEELNPEITFE
jgi:hypothetical protein